MTTATPTVLSSHAQATTAGAPKAPKTATFADADPDVLRFVNRRAEITVPIATCKLERTVEGASNITVRIHDPALSFLNSEAIQGPEHGQLESFVVLEDQVFTIAGVHLLKGHIVEVILEDESVYRLRQNKKALTMSRGSVTRAQFIKHMFAESGVPLNAPELDKKQPQKTPEEETRAQKNKKHKPGLAAHAKLTVKQQPADAEQRQNIETALEAATSHQSSELAAIALLEAIIQENDGRSPNILQLEPFNVSGDHVDPNDVAAVSALFLTKGFTGNGGAIALAKAHPTWNAGQIAQAVQGSAYPDAYQVWVKEATAMVNAFTGGAGLQESTTFVKEYQYERKAGEDSWAAARRLAEEVGWYLFIVDGEGHFYSGEYLKKGMPLMLVAPGADGLKGNPTFGYMTSHSYEDSVTVECDASKWAAPPGSIAELEGYGPVDGRWITTTIARERMKSSVTIITLGRGKLPKKEPAHELGTRSASSAAPVSLTVPTSKDVLARLAREHPELKSGVREVVGAILTKFPELTITSTTSGTHASHSLHFEGRAADLAGGDMDAIGTWIAQHLTAKLTEGIHNPTLSVKDGKPVGSSFWGTAVWAEHVNHIHIGV
jgi:hypothetical protein